MRRSWHRTVARAMATAAVLASLWLPAQARPTDSSEADSPATYPPRVTMITDSVGGVLFRVTQEQARLAEGLDFRLETKTCRKLVERGCYADGESPPSVLETVETLGAELGDLVVVDVGYNDWVDRYARDLDTVMAALAAAGVERVVWVTLYEGQAQWGLTNAQIRAATTRWPQLTVADWAPVAAREPEWFVDQAHMNDLGAAGFVDFLRPIILEACGAACVPPEATATMRTPIVRAHKATLRWIGNPFAKSYDVAVRRVGGPWHTVVTRLEATSFSVRVVPGARMQARARARDANDLVGRWSPPMPFRL
jgi:hypothetical protein